MIAGQDVPVIAIRISAVKCGFQIVAEGQFRDPDLLTLFTARASSIFGKLLNGHTIMLCRFADTAQTEQMPVRKHRKRWNCGTIYDTIHNGFLLVFVCAIVKCKLNKKTAVPCKFHA